MADQMADQTYGRWQFPDPPGNYPAPVSFVLRKFETVRSELVNVEKVLTSAQNAADAAGSTASKANDAIILHMIDKQNPHGVTAEQTGARSLADLAVYEEKDGKAEKTEDELVKKSEVTHDYTDQWVFDEIGEMVQLYFTWVEDKENFWLSNFEGWDGKSAPPSFPVYYTAVSDARATSATLTCFRNGLSEEPVELQARRLVNKNALGLALVGDGVSEFANDAGYLKADDLAGIKGPVVSEGSVSSGDSLRVVRPDNKTDVFKASADYGLEVRSYADNSLCFRVDSGNTDKTDADHWYGSGAVEAHGLLTCYSGLNNLNGGSIRWNGDPAIFDQLWITDDSAIGGIMSKEDADVYISCKSGESKHALFKCDTTFGGGFTVRFEENEARFTGLKLDDDDDDESKAGFIGMDSKAQHSDVRNRFVVGAVATDLVLKVRDKALVLTEDRLNTLSSVLDDYEAANKDLEEIA